MVSQHPTSVTSGEYRNSFVVHTLDCILVLIHLCPHRALADPNNQGKLNKDEFAVAMHLVYRRLNGGDLPASLPDDLIPPSSRDISETLDFVKRSLLTDIPSKAGTTNWGSYASSSAGSSTSLSKRLSVRSPDDVGYVSSARRGNITTSPAPNRNAVSGESSVGRLQKQIVEQRLVLEALSNESNRPDIGEDREISDLKDQIRSAQNRLQASPNKTLHLRITNANQDLARLRAERRNMDQEVAALLRSVSTLASNVRETDKSLEESRLELAKIKSGGPSGDDANITGTGPGGAVTAEDRMKSRIALMKAQRMAALTGKPIPSAAQSGIDRDQAARIRAERDVNEQNVSEVETAVRRLEDTMRQLERGLDTQMRPQGNDRAEADRRKWDEGAGVESEIAQLFLQQIRTPTASTAADTALYQSSTMSSSRINAVSPSSQQLNADEPTHASSPISRSQLLSAPASSTASLVGKTPEERRAIIRAQAEKRLRDRQNDILARAQSSRSESASPAPAPTADVSDVDAFTSAKFEEAERVAREKLLANAESKRRQAELDRQMERDVLASREQRLNEQKKLEDERLNEQRKLEDEHQIEREYKDRLEVSERQRLQHEEDHRLPRQNEENGELEERGRHAQSTLTEKKEPAVSVVAPSATVVKNGAVRITLDSNPFAKHRKSISSSDDDWDTTSPINATPPLTIPSANPTAGSNNPFFRMLSSNVMAPDNSKIVHSKDTSDGWDVVEKDVEVDQLSQKLFSAPLIGPGSISISTGARFEVLESSPNVLVPAVMPQVSSIPPPPPPPPPPAPVLAGIHQTLLTHLFSLAYCNNNFLHPVH